MKIKKALITAAGFGSRFLPITKTFPKEMLPIINKPIIHWIIEECAAANIEEVIIVASPDEVRTFEDYFYGHAENIKQLMYEQGKVDRWEKVEKIFELPKITVIPENRKLPYGNGRPILTAKNILKKEKSFVICWGDDLMLSKTPSVKQIVDYFSEQQDCDAVLGVVPAPIELLTKGAVIVIKEGTKNQVARMKEKPSEKELSEDKSYSNLYSIGRFVLTPKVYDYLTPDATGRDGELWLQDVNDKVAQNGKTLFKKLEGKFYTTGDPEKYLEAQKAFFKKYGMNNGK